MDAKYTRMLGLLQIRHKLAISATSCLMRVKKITAIVAIIVVCIVAYVTVSFYKRHYCSADVSSAERLFINNNELTVLVADTEALRTQGLSGTDRVPYDGMLFVFPAQTTPAFWMKDMRYPIDIVWIKNDHTVLSVLLNVDPKTYPQSFTPTSPIRFVLELPAGNASQLGITSGTLISGFGKKEGLQLFGLCEPLKK